MAMACLPCRLVVGLSVLVCASAQGTGDASDNFVDLGERNSDCGDIEDTSATRDAGCLFDEQAGVGQCVTYSMQDAFSACDAIPSCGFIRDHSLYQFQLLVQACDSTPTSDSGTQLWAKGSFWTSTTSTSTQGIGGASNNFVDLGALGSFCSDIEDTSATRDAGCQFLTVMDSATGGVAAVQCWTYSMQDAFSACDAIPSCGFINDYGSSQMLRQVCENPLDTAMQGVQLWAKGSFWTMTTTTILGPALTSPNSTQVPPDGTRPGDAVEVKCSSERAYHLAAVHNVSSTSIVVVYELMGHLYYCTPKVWRTVVANQTEVCGPHGGIKPAWGGDKCCPSSCGECGTADCHTRPGGRNSCCTRRIPDHYICGKDGRTAPCTLVATLPFAQVRRLRGDVDTAGG